MSELNDDSGLWYSVKGTGNEGIVTIYGDYSEHQKAVLNASTLVGEGRDISELSKQDVNTIAWVAIASAFNGRPQDFERSVEYDFDN